MCVGWRGHKERVPLLRIIEFQRRLLYSSSLPSLQSGRKLKCSLSPGFPVDSPLLPLLVAAPGSSALCIETKSLADRLVMTFDDAPASLPDVASQLYAYTLSAFSQTDYRSTIFYGEKLLHLITESPELCSSFSPPSSATLTPFKNAADGSSSMSPASTSPTPPKNNTTSSSPKRYPPKSHSPAANTTSFVNERWMSCLIQSYG